MKEAVRKPIVQCAALICLCFLLGSIGWLSWEYHLMAQVSAETSDICTMIIGYLLQAVGIGLYAAVVRRRGEMAERLFPLSLIMHLLFMVPAVISPYTAGTLIFGFLMNLCCGITAGFYLSRLTAVSAAFRRASAFGCGYGAAILLQWLISLLWRSVYYSEKVLIVCALVTCVLLVQGRSAAGRVPRNEAVKERSCPAPSAAFLFLPCLLVLLFSMINSSGFAFSSADVSKSVNVELSRLVYAAGLIIAGAVSDKSRKHGAVCALTALMMPFIILALRKETVSSVIFWALSYFTFGFYAVFRIILFSDIASDRNALYLSGFGLMFGRIGDAAGEGLCLLFEGRMTFLICLTAALFIGAVIVFFRVYSKLYIPEIRQEQSEKEKFLSFSTAHDLSPRERDMLRLLLEGRTNLEIADTLSISENTVKFHIRNLLQKTGCKNRNDLVAGYTNNIKG